jgi:hypothetical protein
MSAWIEPLIQSTDPLTAGLLLAIAYYVRSMRSDLRRELKANRKRISRLEKWSIDPDQEPKKRADGGPETEK